MKYSNFYMLKRILGYAKNYYLILITSFISAILYVVSTLLSPIIIGKAIDEFIDSNTFMIEDILIYIYYLLAVVILGAFFGWLMNFLLNKVTYGIIKNLRIDSFKKVLNVDVSYLDSHLSGDILTRIISDTDQVSEGLLQGFQQVLTGIITIIATIIIMLIIRWQIALVVIFLTPLSLFVASFISKISFKTFKAQAEIKGEMGAFLNEMISNEKMVIAYNQQEINNTKFKEIDKRLYNVGINAQFNSSLTNPATRFVNALVYAAVATIGSILIITEVSTFKVGSLTAFLTYASQYTKPFNEISAVATELSNSFASLRRVFELIDEKEINDESNMPSLEVLDGNVKFCNVKFRYVETKPLIEDLNIDVKSGSQVAIVGKTGCGKTTMINLLMRYYDLNQGTIYIDGKDISQYNRDSLRNEISMVLQETWVFNGTIYDNIAYGKENATKEEVIEASKLAYADDFIMKLPYGYDTIISDDGGISQGQKQLLCIARLMLRKTKILILDEATSNIDTRTEVLVGKAFKKLMEGRTSFIIAHRLSTIRNADLILVMDKGKIIEQGNHLELINKDGYYKSLYYSQFK